MVAAGVAMTQLESAKRGITTPEMQRVARRECADPDFIRTEVARGRLVIPANVRHLAGSGGGEPTPPNGHERGYPDVAIGHPEARTDARLWVNQTVTQRWAVVSDPAALRGERAPKRLDPTGIGRLITTKVNANIGASPVARAPAPRSRSSSGRSATAPTR
jgi:thiamine biosynthesis protein ThiC